MTKEEKIIAIKNLRLAIDLAGDGGPAAFYSDEEDMMRDLLDEIERPLLSNKNTEDSLVEIDKVIDWIKNVFINIGGDGINDYIIEDFINSMKK